MGGHLSSWRAIAEIASWMEAAEGGSDIIDGI